MSRGSRIAIFAFSSASLSFAVAVGLLSLAILYSGEEHDLYWSFREELGSRLRDPLQISIGMLIGGVVSSSFGSLLPRALRIIQLTMLIVAIALPVASLIDVLSRSNGSNAWFLFQFSLVLHFARYGLPLLLAMMVWSLIWATIERRAERIPCVPS